MSATRGGPERESRKPLTADALDRYLGDALASDDRAAECGAVAVLAAFDPFKTRLSAGGAEPDRDEMLDRVLPVSEPLPEGLWTLSLAERRSALRALGTREKMKVALAVNPERPALPAQLMLERVLNDESIAVNALSRDELAALLLVLEWVDGILEGLPDRDAVKHALTRADLLAPLQRLAGGGFVNRVDELSRLEQYVLGPPQPVPLFVFGAGGVGKSTLLSRFLLQSADRQQWPLAYLDIDRPTIRPDRPLTIVLEAIAQLQPQLGVPRVATESLVKEITFMLSRMEGGRQLESAGPSEWVFGIFKSIFEPALQKGRVVIVIDTFEEAQFLGQDVVYPFLDFLFGFGKMMSRFRLIVSGRALPDEYVQLAFPHAIVRPNEAALTDRIDWDAIRSELRPINLEVLGEAAARELLDLAVRANELEPLSDEDAADIIRIVSRNPMCLKLAGRLLRSQGVEKLRAARSEILATLKSEKIQALLYGRILRHLHGEGGRLNDLTRVAYPGLVVRRIDVDVIREVLATPCRLELTPERNEHAIFAGLAREAALVERDPEDGSLRHRPDVRRAMLEDLTDHVAQDVIDAIDRSAVAFYEKRNDRISRAEEIYHRLRLCQEPDVLERRWMPDAAMRLKGAGDELRAAQRLWLAEKLGITLDESVRVTANQEAWERQAARSADRYLHSHDAQGALEVLHERPERVPRSSLFALEAEAYRLLGKHDDALRVARAGVESASAAGAVDLVLELLLRMVVIEEGRGRLDAAERLLSEAEAVAVNTSNELLRLRVIVTLLRVQRQRRPKGYKERAVLREAASAILTPDVLRQLRHSPVLLREVAAELTKHEPRVAAVAIETLGLEVGSDVQARKLGQAVSTLAGTESVDYVLAPEVMQAVKRIEGLHFDPEAVREWVTHEVSRKDTQRVASRLKTVNAGENVLREFRDYFREGVANVLRSGGDFGI